MRKLLLASLLLLPGQALAGPPEGVSGRMALAPDEVADGLRKYRLTKGRKERGDLLCRLALASSKDPRVAVALGEALGDKDLSPLARDLLAGCGYVMPPDVIVLVIGPEPYYFAEDWWKANEADLRRRAKALPR